MVYVPDPPPPLAGSQDVYIVSDLHLSNGYSARSGRYDPREDFFYDVEFVNLLRYIARESNERKQSVRLILLGDSFDLLQVDGMPAPTTAAYQDPEVQDTKATGRHFYGLGTSPTSTNWRLERIATGHPDWFAALGELLMTCPLARIEVVAGNHDIELIWREAQAMFRQLVVQRSDPAVAERIWFAPWFIYEPGFFYAEHGQQYDSLNSFATMLYPVLPGQEQLIELPLGSFFVRYIFNQIERFDYFSDNIRPITRYITWALLHHPITGLATLFYHARFLRKVRGKASKQTEKQREARRMRYWREVLAPYAARIGLRTSQLVAIDRCAALPSMYSRGERLQQLFGPLVPVTATLLFVVAVLVLLPHARSDLRAAIALAAGLMAVLAWRERALLRPPKESPNALRSVAHTIDGILRNDGGAGANFFVFGHTHKAEVFALGEAEAELPRYINSGTWTPIIDSGLESRLLRGIVQLNVVRLRREADGKQRGELMMWNDGAQRLDRVPLVGE